MSAVATGAAVGVLMASSSAGCGPSAAMPQGVAILLLVLFSLSLVGGAVSAYRRAGWSGDRWGDLLYGSIGTFACLGVITGVVGLVAVAVEA